MYIREKVITEELIENMNIEFYNFLKSKSIEEIIRFFRMSPEVEFIYQVDKGKIKKIFSESPYLDIDKEGILSFVKNKKERGFISSNLYLFLLKRNGKLYAFIRGMPFIINESYKVFTIRMVIIFVWGLTFLFLITIILRPFRYIKELSYNKVFEGILDRKTLESIKKKEMEKDLIFLGHTSSILVHEINNITASLLTTIKLIKLESENKEIENILYKIENKIFELKTLLNEYTSLMKGERIELKTANIRELIEKSVKDIEKLIELQGKKIKISMMLKDINIRCSPLLTQKAFYNILKNSFEAIEKEGEIKIRTEIKKKKLIITFEDSGKGIPSDEIEKIFIPFYTTKSNSLGIGLSMVYYLFRLQNWDIKIVSETGKRTEVNVIIPYEG